MAILQITDDNDKTSSYTLIKCNVSCTSTFSSSSTSSSLLLELFINEAEIKYEIFPDEREKSVSQIAQFILQELDAISKSNRPFIISEYLKRHYISIGDIEIKRRQFTAHKLS